MEFVTAVCLLSKVEKGGFHGVQLQTPKKGEAWYCGTLFNTSIDRVRAEIRLIVSLYLDELPNFKCVNFEVKTVNSLPKRGSLQWVHGTMSEPPWKSH